MLSITKIILTEIERRIRGGRFTWCRKLYKNEVKWEGRKALRFCFVDCLLQPGNDMSSLFVKCQLLWSC